ncbi:unnamed protein product [Xylocopa violacea]|uniref:Uncharacterized protein n=1 Tax=Xylocopa violacea TaxID=135666 RepID=A0ABP1N772_XYLVO
MNIAFALLALLAISSPLYAYRLPASGSGELADQLQKLLDILPLDKLVNITRTYATHDAEFSKRIANATDYLGLDMRSLINDYKKTLEPDHAAPLTPPWYPITGGLRGYSTDILNVIPTRELADLFDDVLLPSKVFMLSLTILISQDCADLYRTILQNPHYLNLEQRSVDQGLERNFFRGAIVQAAVCTSLL